MPGAGYPRGRVHKMARGIRQAVKSGRVAVVGPRGRPVSLERQGAVLAHIVASRNLEPDDALLEVLGALLANGLTRRELTAIAWLEFSDLEHADLDEVDARRLRAKLLETLRKLMEPEESGDKIPAQIAIQVNVGAEAARPTPAGDPIQVG